MAAKGYCTFMDVANFLGVALTASQEVYAASLIEAAENTIDIGTNRAWLTGALTDEAYYRDAFRLGKLYLRYAPVSTITSIKGRAGLGDAETTLVADTDYEVLDLSDGLLRLVAPYAYDRLRVTYTPTATAPAPVARACAELVGSWMQPSLRPNSYGLYSYSLPDLTVQFAKEAALSLIPDSVQAVIDLYRWRVVA